MTVSSLTLTSELLALRGLSTVVVHDGYAVQTTPDEPDYWMGNQVIVTAPDMPPKDAIAAFEHHFPWAKHRAIVWDHSGLNPDPVRSALVPLGYEVETFDALALQGGFADADTPNGVVLRPLMGSDDWAQSLQLQCEIGQEEGRPADSHAAYIARRNDARRTQIALGLGQWFGAFEGDLLVAQMGMMHDQHIARYQSVETRITHRRRGICAALLRTVGQWAADRAPDAQIVIVAEADSAAGRLYRRMGFAHVETLVGALKPGY